MSFSHSPKPPAPETLLRDLDTLGRMTDGQFYGEVNYWQDLRARGGERQFVVATTLLAHVFEPLDMCRLYGSIPPAERPPDQEETAKHLLRPALAGLALSRLLRQAYDVTMRQHGFATAGQVIGIDMVFTGDHPVAAIYHPKEAITQVLPDYRPGVSPDWYEDEALMVRTREPAKPTMEFQQTFALANEEEFAAADHITLRPQLKKTYIQQPG